MSERVNRFLGGSPLGVIMRLILLSIVVGVILSWLSWSPADVIDWFVGLFDWLWYNIFGSLDRALDYFLLGAAIVIPIFIISRLLTMGRR